MLSILSYHQNQIAAVIIPEITHKDESLAKASPAIPWKTWPLLASGIHGAHAWERAFVTLVSKLWEENCRASQGWGDGTDRTESSAFPADDAAREKPVS